MLVLTILLYPSCREALSKIHLVLSSALLKTESQHFCLGSYEKDTDITLCTTHYLA